jgi:hypothetical protein
MSDLVSIWISQHTFRFSGLTRPCLSGRPVRTGELENYSTGNVVLEVSLITKNHSLNQPDFTSPETVQKDSSDLSKGEVD